MNLFAPSIGRLVIGQAKTGRLKRMVAALVLMWIVPTGFAWGDFTATLGNGPKETTIKVSQLAPFQVAREGTPGMVSQERPPTLVFLENADRQKVEYVQEWLFNRGFPVLVDGIYGPQTESGIRKFQAALGNDVTGQLTTDEFALLNTFQLPEVWGAISMSSDGQVGYAYGKSSRALAMMMAERRCRTNSARPEDCLAPAVTIDDLWTLAVLCKQGSQAQLYSVTHSSPDDAFEMVIDALPDNFDRADCEIKAQLSARTGLHDPALASSPAEIPSSLDDHVAPASIAALFAAECEAAKTRTAPLPCPFRATPEMVTTEWYGNPAPVASTNVDLFEEPGSDRVVATLGKGESAELIRATVFSVPCRMLAPMDEGKIRKGQIIYRLWSAGEGTYQFWVDGEIVWPTLDFAGEFREGSFDGCPDKMAEWALLLTNGNKAGWFGDWQWVQGIGFKVNGIINDH